MTDPTPIGDSRRCGDRPPASGLGPYIYRRTTFRFLSDNPQIAQNRVKFPRERECISGPREPRVERPLRVRWPGASPGACRAPVWRPLTHELRSLIFQEAVSEGAHVA